MDIFVIKYSHALIWCDQWRSGEPSGVTSLLASWNTQDILLGKEKKNVRLCEHDYFSYDRFLFFLNDSLIYFANSKIYVDWLIRRFCLTLADISIFLSESNTGTVFGSDHLFLLHKCIDI